MSGLTHDGLDAPIWHPFTSLHEWQFARWITKNLGQSQTDSLLKLPLVRTVKSLLYTALFKEHYDLSFHNSYSLMKRIDQLPMGPDWTCELVHIKGDRVDETGKLMAGDAELWMRDPLECIRELMSNPAFRDVVCYAPERAYADEEGKEHLYDEMWTADWWWNTQLKLPPGAVVAPIILSSDETNLSQFRGDQKAWPVYLTLGNIAKDVRSRPSSHATVLIGYLPVSKLEMFTSETCSAARHRLYHFCMSRILRSLVQAGKDGVDMTYPDGFVRRIFPILAAYVADYPEQVLAASCRKNTCPCCLVDPKRRGEPLHTEFRDPETTLSIIRAHMKGEDEPHFVQLNLRPIYTPFWHDLPFANIHTCFTPDLLHQLHKGVFHDHLLKWCRKHVGKEEIDMRFQRMTPFPGLRQFSSGISSVSQWTGAEHQEMEKVFVGALTGTVNKNWSAVSKALVDFIFYARLHTHPLANFHKEKDIVIQDGIRKHFNIPKMHSTAHYADFIRSHGSTVGFNTEHPERLHIDYAKVAYAPMTKWLRRQEAVELRRAPILYYCDVDLRGSGERLQQDARTEGVILPKHSPPGASPRLFRLALSCPSPNTRVDRLVDQYGTQNFIPALNSFLSKKLPRSPARATERDLRCLYTYTIHAAPGQPAQGRHPPQPPSFDTVLIVDPEADSGIRPIPSIEASLRVARVRALFTIPGDIGQVTGPLAYVELFTPLRVKDPTSGLYLMSASTRNHRRHSVVVSVDDFVSPCHLIPKSSPPASWPRQWAPDTVLDVASQFYLNMYIDLHTFVLFWPNG
ncbi:hypothetical protein BC834DRAFT_925906 [Gloeopeniophorella convolvens]|nr:hypothetical protein BC834DRAFT_925906 [Gloeopeniophorella convolvens]